MLQVRKIIFFMMFATLLTAFIVCSNYIYADNSYPLDNGEKLIEEQAIDNSHVEIFTQINDQFYKKKLERINGHWAALSTQEINTKWTGLKIEQSNKQGDRKLSKALQKELVDSGFGITSLPKTVDYSNSEFLPPVGLQHENSCVGWSTGYYLRTYQQAKDIGWPVMEKNKTVKSHIFSPTFIYNQINNGEDDGAYIEDAAKILKDVGAASLEDFPYVPGDYSTIPPETVVKSAYSNRIREWRLLFTENDTDDYIIQQTKEYLNTGDLVVVGSKIGLKFQNPCTNQDGESIITTDNYCFLKHAYTIVGYDDTLVTPEGVGAFKLVNSWGTDWGNKGFSYISYKAFAANVIEGCVLTDLENCIRKDVKVDVNDVVTFNMGFSGSGNYDIKIKNANDNVIYEKSNLQGEAGLNTFAWIGSDNTGKKADDGLYKLNIISYEDQNPKPPFEYSFNKVGKVERSSGSAYVYEDSIQYIEIPIVFKLSGILNIKVNDKNNIKNLITNQVVNAGESKIYRISKKDYDINNKDLDKISILIDVK